MWSSRAAPIAVGGAFWLAFIWRTRFYVDGKLHFVLFDDAMISMTYARTLASGHGLVWYPGAPRVEGFTNPLWTLFMAVIHLFPIPDRFTSLVVMASGVLILAVIALLVRAVADSFSTGAGPVAMWTVCLAYPLAYWTLRGMEVGAVALMVTVSVLLAFRMLREPTLARGAALGGCLAVGLLLRNDFLVTAVVIIGVLAWCGRTNRDARRAVAVVVLIPLLVVVVGSIVRVAYYGELTPNTYSLKIVGWPLASRARRAFGILLETGAGQWWLAVGFAVFAFRGKKRVARSTAGDARSHRRRAGRVPPLRRR